MHLKKCKSAKNSGEKRKKPGKCIFSYFLLFVKPHVPISLFVAQCFECVCVSGIVWAGSGTLYVICGHTLIVNVSHAVMRASCLSSADWPASACQLILEEKTHLSLFSDSLSNSSVLR